MELRSVGLAVKRRLGLVGFDSGSTGLQWVEMVEHLRQRPDLYNGRKVSRCSMGKEKLEKI